MYASWTTRLRFLKRHLMMFFLAIGWLMVQSQVAVASHDCQLDLRGNVAAVQHMDMLAMSSAHPDSNISPLCEKHCVPDRAQKETAQPQVVALPAAMTLVLNAPECTESVQHAWSLTPPAVGPPATIRFCRFRE